MRHDELETLLLAVILLGLLIGAAHLVERRARQLNWPPPTMEAR